MRQGTGSFRRSHNDGTIFRGSAKYNELVGRCRLLGMIEQYDPHIIAVAQRLRNWDPLRSLAATQARDGTISKALRKGECLAVSKADPKRLRHERFYAEV